MSNIVKELCAKVNLPKMARARQCFDSSSIAPSNISHIAAEELRSAINTSLLKKGQRVAICCGSRGIAHINIIIKAIVDLARSLDLEPFIVPAMGSHGGASAEGQRALLERYGISEVYLDCPLISSMETVEIGRTESGFPVRIDKNAAGADWIIACGRVKPHTDFRARYESGIVKMLAVGLGKRDGAELCHSEGFENLGSVILELGSAVLSKAKILGALALVENAFHEIYSITGLKPEEILEKEPALLEKARSLMPVLKFKNADLLVVDKIGKDISGDGMDPNITGTSPCAHFFTKGFRPKRLCALDLSEESGGQAFGIGAAHTTTRRLFNKIEPYSTYINAISCKAIEYARIPALLDSDREAIQMALLSCEKIDINAPRIIRIADTNRTVQILISEPMLDEAAAMDDIELLSEPEDWPFDRDGNLW